MTLPREVVLELMAFADGELDGAAHARAEALVATNAEARGFVEATRSAHLSAFLEDAIDRKAASAGADAIAESVMKALAAEQSSPRPDTLSAPRAEPALRLQARVPRAPLDSQSVRTSLGVATFGVALAMAAGVALYVTRHPRPDDGAPVAKVELAPAKPAGAAAETAPADGVEVDEIDSPAHDISVFEINGNAAAAANQMHPSSVVIWVEDSTASGSK